MPTLVTKSLTHCRLIHLIDVILACDDANSKLVDVVTVADVDADQSGRKCGVGSQCTCSHFSARFF